MPLKLLKPPEFYHRQKHTCGWGVFVRATKEKNHCDPTATVLQYSILYFNIALGRICNWYQQEFLFRCDPKAHLEILHLTTCRICLSPSSALSWQRGPSLENSIHTHIHHRAQFWHSSINKWPLFCPSEIIVLEPLNWRCEESVLRRSQMQEYSQLLWENSLKIRTVIFSCQSRKSAFSAASG